MEKREFIIEIHERNFVISQKDLIYENLTKRNDVDWTDDYFGNFFLKDDKIVEIFDMFPYEREITRASGDERFYEVVKFEVEFLDKKMKPYSFESDFLQALIWINKNWKNWHKEDEE